MASKSKPARHRWSLTFKKRITDEAMANASCAKQIARRYDLTANLVLNWQKEFGSGAASMPSMVLRAFGWPPRQARPTLA